MEFRYYLVRRLALQAVVIVGVVSLSFILIHVIPADPVLILVGEQGYRNPVARAAVIAHWHLNDPLWAQYLWYIDNMFHGNFGQSLWTGRPVIDDLLSRLPATMEIAIGGFLISIVIAIPLGILSAAHRGSKIDHFARFFSILGVSAPRFWWGILLLLIFYLYLGISVGTARLSPQFSPPPTVTGLYTVDSLIAGDLPLFFDAVKHLILPDVTMGITSTALTMRLVRSSMLEIIDSDYIRTARLKGLGEGMVIMKHAFRNALIPVITWLSPMFAVMMGGSVMIETVFAWNGIGFYAVQTLLANDYPAVMGVVFLMAVLFTFANLVVDLLYGLLDPRMRIG